MPINADTSLSRRVANHHFEDTLITFILLIAQLGRSIPTSVKMYSPSILISLLSLFLSSIDASPLTKRDSSPSINVIFFSDTNCTTTVPPTIYTRPVYGDESCYFYPNQDLYQSLIIDEIDDQFIGTNTALQVGNTAGDTCDFEDSLKYSVASKDVVGQCQFIGIPGGAGQLLKGGNEYRLTSLEG